MHIKKKLTPFSLARVYLQAHIKNAYAERKDHKIYQHVPNTQLQNNRWLSKVRSIMTRVL